MSDAGEDFITELFSEDALGVVIRAAIRVEAELNRFIEDVVPMPGELPRMDFKDKLALARAMGLAKEFGPGVSALANIRNKFAHRIGAALSEDDIKNFYKTMSSSEKETFQGMADSVAPEELNDPMNRLRLMLAAVYLDLQAWINRQMQAKALRLDDFWSA
jgi:hypothetical protein